jgi:putative transposase
MLKALRKSCNALSIAIIDMGSRIEPYGVGSYLHVYNRGVKKEPIFFSKSDYWRFLWCLRFFNEERPITKLARCLSDLIFLQKQTLRNLSSRDYRDGRNTFEWRQEWGEQKPIVEIISFNLSPNHFHLLLKEIIVGGIAKFMRKLGAGYTEYQNTKNNGSGHIFQGSYKAKIVEEERYLQYLDAYIHVLNPFELFEGGIDGAIKNFDKAFDFALNYPFCSLGESFGLRNLNITNRECFKSIFNDLQNYKEFCRDALIVRNGRSFLGKLTID